MPDPGYDYLQQHPLISIINVNWGAADVGILELGTGFPEGTPKPHNSPGRHSMMILSLRKPGIYAMTDIAPEGVPYTFAASPVDKEAFTWIGAQTANNAVSPDPVAGGWHKFGSARRFDPYNYLYENYTGAYPPFQNGVGTVPWIYTAPPGAPNPGDYRTALVPDPAHYQLPRPDSRNFWNNYAWAVGFVNGQHHDNTDTFLFNFWRLRKDWLSGNVPGDPVLINKERPPTPNKQRKPMRELTFQWGNNLGDQSQDPGGGAATHYTVRFRSWSGVGGRFKFQVPEDGGVDYVSYKTAVVAKVFEYNFAHKNDGLFVLVNARYNMRHRFEYTRVSGGGATLVDWPDPPPPFYPPPSTLLAMEPTARAEEVIERKQVAMAEIDQAQIAAATRQLQEFGYI